MLDKTAIPFISAGIPRSIKEYLPLEQRSLLLDILYFLSIKTEKAQFCTDKDIATSRWTTGASSGRRAIGLPWRIFAIVNARRRGKSRRRWTAK